MDISRLQTSSYNIEVQTIVGDHHHILPREVDAANLRVKKGKNNAYHYFAANVLDILRQSQITDWNLYQISEGQTWNKNQVFLCSCLRFTSWTSINR